MSRFWPMRYHNGNPNMYIKTREIGDIPNCVPAVDIMKFVPNIRSILHGDDREYLVILNPAPKFTKAY